MLTNEDSDRRPGMLYAWALGWLDRNGDFLATEGVRRGVRVARRTYYVTSEQALAALHKTLEELADAFERRPDWGTDGWGHASEFAVRGLIARRFADRLVDEARRRKNVPSMVHLDARMDREDDDGESLVELLPCLSNISAAEDRIWLEQILANETPKVRVAVLGRAFGGPAIADLSNAAARQRIHRFARKHRADLIDAAA